MARQYTDGAESGDESRIIAASRLGTFSYAATDQKRTGNYSYYDDNGDYLIFKIYSPVLTECYTRSAHRFNHWETNGAIIQLYSGTTLIGYVRVTTGAGGTGTLGFVTNAVLDTSSGFTWALNEWHVIETYIKIHASAGIVQVKFDGTQVLNYSGKTDHLGASFDRHRFIPSPAGSSNKGWTDDIAVNDTTTANDNSWIGDGGVLAALVPNGVGNYTDLIDSPDGGAGLEYQAVDEIPHNSDTDYVYESTLNKKSTYAMSAVSTPPTGASIARVWVEVVAKESAADGDKIATFLRSGATDAQGSDQALTLAYARYLSAEYLTDPADAAAWTTTKVNALEAGAIVR